MMCYYLNVHFYRQKVKEETSRLLHLEQIFVWCRNLDTSGSRLEIPESFAACWKGMEISRTDRVRNEVYHRVAEEMNILHTIERRKANWVGLILGTNCLIKQVIGGNIEGRTEVTGFRGRSKQLLDGRKENRGYWKYGSNRSHSVESSLWKKL